MGRRAVALCGLLDSPGGCETAGSAGKTGTQDSPTPPVPTGCARTRLRKGGMWRLAKPHPAALPSSPAAFLPAGGEPQCPAAISHFPAWIQQPIQGHNSSPELLVPTSREYPRSTPPVLLSIAIQYRISDVPCRTASSVKHGFRNNLECGAGLFHCSIA